MEFEEMQIVWNTQTREPLYVLDRAALHASVRRKARSIARGVNAMEIGTIVISLVLTTILAGEPLLSGIDRHQYLSAAILFAVALYLGVGRLRRRRREQGFESTLVGDLQRALFQVDYHIRRVRTFAWWFLAPCLLTLAISFSAKWESKPLWLWGVCLAAFGLALWVVRLELGCVHLARKRELETLLAKLTAAE